MLARRNTRLISIDTWVVDGNNTRVREFCLPLMEIMELLKSIPHLKQKHFIVFDYLDDDSSYRDQKQAFDLAKGFTLLASEDNVTLRKLSLAVAHELEQIGIDEQYRSMQVYREYDHLTASFQIYPGEDDPAVVTEAIGLKPYRSVRKGDAYRTVLGERIKRKRSHFPHSLWEFRSDLPETVSAEEQVKRLLGMCEPYRLNFREAAKKYGHLHLRINGYVYDYNSYFELDSELMKKINGYNADVSIYFYHARVNDDWIA